MLNPMKTQVERAYWLTAIVVLLTTIILLAMGRVPWCECGTIKPWYGAVMTSENSQHLMDWYTPSHLLHGFIFYAILWLVARNVIVGWRLLIATIVEAAWEILENTNAVIERYREVTISLDYYGDSVVNSFADIIAMLVGFWMARHFPVWLSFVIVIGFEVLTAWVIRDGLALNVLMLLYPLDAVRDWQGAL